LQKRIKYYLALSVFFFSAIASASEAWEKAMVDMSQYQNSQGEFEQLKKLKVLKHPIKSSGRFVINVGKGLIWRTVKPVESVLIITDGNIYQVKQNQKKMLGGGAQASAIANVMLQLLSGNSAQIKDNFSVVETHSNDHNWSLVLAPKQNDIQKLFAQISLQGASRIEQVTLVENNGTESVISFTNINHQALSTSQLELLNEPVH